MAQITSQTVKDKKTWETFLKEDINANFLQSWAWGEFQRTLGNAIERTGFFEEGKLKGVMLSIVDSAKRGKYLTVPAGPLINWKNPKAVTAFVKEAKKIAQRHNCSFVRVRPQLETSRFSISLFKRQKFIDAPMHLHAELTSQLDITKTEEELLAGMRKSTRYEIRKATAQKIITKTSTNALDIKDFYKLQLQTAKRQKFVPFSYKFLSEQFKIFAANGNALLYKADFEDKPLAQAFIIFYAKEAVYHYGASSDLGRKYPGAYLIQWEAIKEAKRRGMTRYNFWGVSPLGSSHRFDGLSIFKRGFGGQDVSYLHAQDLVISHTRYFFNFLVEKIRKKIRNV